MYRWYATARVCIVYLDDIDSKDDLPRSEWFERGWTLQELSAPRKIAFFNAAWDVIGSKRTLCDTIARITGIPGGVLRNKISPQECSIAQRMSWAANRRTEHIEDIAYSLFGTFDVNMPLIYGEGE